MGEKLCKIWSEIVSAKISLRINFGPESKQGVLEMKTRKPVLFLHLVSSIMKCLHLGLVRNKDPGIQKYLREKIHTEHISCLAWLVQNLDALIVMVDSSSKKEANFNVELVGLGADVMEMLQEMVMNGIVGHQYLQGVLLNELGLNAKCWPLKVSSAALSLLGRVLVCRLEEGVGMGNGGGRNGGDDPLTVNIWKG